MHCKLFNPHQNTPCVTFWVKKLLSRQRMQKPKVSPKQETRSIDAGRAVPVPTNKSNVCMDEFQSWATPKTRILLNVGKGDPYEQAKYAVRIVCQAVAMFCLGMSVLCKDFHWHACDFMEFVNLLPTTKISNILRSTSGRLTRESRLLRINRPVSITKRESKYHLLVPKF